MFKGADVGKQRVYIFFCVTKSRMHPFALNFMLCLISLLRPFFVCKTQLFQCFFEG